jgi:hypothetical protein
MPLKLCRPGRVSRARSFEKEENPPKRLVHMEHQSDQTSLSSVNSTLASKDSPRSKVHFALPFSTTTALDFCFCALRFSYLADGYM